MRMPFDCAHRAPLVATAASRTEQAEAMPGVDSGSGMRD